MKIAIIQEWLVTVGGSDKVVKAIADVFPGADIYTLVAKKQVCDELGIDWNFDSRDGGDHLNYYGALKITDYMGNYLYNLKIKKYEKEIKNINLFLSKNQYAEIEYVAKNIVQLIKDEKYKFNEIGIITKNVNQYASLIKAIFAKYDIPVYIDEKKDLNQNILIRYILSILEIIIKNYSYEAVFNFQL